MGEEADRIVDMRLDENLFVRSFQRGSVAYKWRQADGIVIDMYEMSNRHLENALRYATGQKAEEIREVLAEREDDWRVF